MMFTCFIVFDLPGKPAIECYICILYGNKKRIRISNYLNKWIKKELNTNSLLSFILVYLCKLLFYVLFSSCSSLPFSFPFILLLWFIFKVILRFIHLFALKKNWSCVLLVVYVWNGGVYSGEGGVEETNEIKEKEFNCLKIIININENVYSYI